MAVTNLLDRLAEEYEGNHPVEYRAQLAKLGKSIGSRVYSLGGGAKGVSARDIIRKDIKGNDVGVYPFDVLERQRNNKRKDDRMPWDYAIQRKDGGMLLDSFNGGTKADANEYMAQLKAKGIVPKDAKLVSNVSSSRQTAQQKRDLDEFKKAFEDVRAQRDEFNQRKYKGDVLEFPFNKTRWKRVSHDQDNKGRKAALMTYGVDNWNEWLSAKKAAKEAGQNLGRLFAEQNQREKNVYGNISKGLKPSTDAVPEGRYKYALGNQNHVYSDSPDEPQNDWMPLEPQYPGQDALTNSGTEIHWRKDGTPIIDAYTWTQIPHIDNILKTGYLAIEGADTENFHKGVKGHWTSNKDNTPMNLNYENGMEVGKIGPNGENFNEELLHSRLPLGWFQKAPMIHQGPRGSGSYSVDVIQAKPGAPEVMIGEGDRRRLEKVATPAQFINHITEDKMRPDWIMGRPAGRVSVPGWHPNKKDDVNLNDLNIAFNQAYKNYIGNPKNREKANLLLDAMKNPEMKNRLADYYKNTAYSNVSAPEIIKNSRQEYLNYLLEKEQSPYDFIQSVRQKPKVSEGHILNTEGIDRWDGFSKADFPRTHSFILQKQIDDSPMAEFAKEHPSYKNHPEDVAKSIAVKSKPNNGYGLHYDGMYGNFDKIIPTRRFQKNFIDEYLENVGLGRLDNLTMEKGIHHENNPFDNKVYVDRNQEYKYKKDILDDKKSRRSDQAMTYAFRNYNDALLNGNIEGHLTPFNDAMDFTERSKFKGKQSFSFDDWFDAYKNSKGFTNESRIQSERERLEPAVRMYLDELNKLPSDKDLTREAVKERQRKYSQSVDDLSADKYKDFMQADSLDKVIGHMIGRRIGADRAKRGKKIF